MNRENGQGFHFGLEAEYLLVDAETFRPLSRPSVSPRRSFEASSGTFGAASANPSARTEGASSLRRLSCIPRKAAGSNTRLSR